MWSGNSASKEYKGHSDALWSIKSTSDGLITGANDGKIVKWDKSLTRHDVIMDLNTFTGSIPAGVRSMDYDESSQKMLVGTRGAQILECNLSSGKAKILINGHYEGTKQAELWGCTVHPQQQIVATCGADKTIRLWEENRMISASAEFEHDLTAADWASSGNFIVVGDRNGCIHTVDARSLQKIDSADSSLKGKKNAWVEDVKISPDCSTICFGTHGGLSKLEVIQVKPNGQMKRVSPVNMGLSSALTHLDWTLDSSTVVVNSQGYELLWYNVQGKSKVNASSTRDFDYATWTSLFGFPVQGIWPNPDYSDVNTACRSFSQKLLATGEDSGLVKLFRYPCVTEGAAANEYAAHSSHVTKVKFTAND